MDAKITVEFLAKLERTLDPKEWNLLENVLLRKAFDLVCDPTDWRAPIAKDVEMAYVDFEPGVITRAVAHMTATLCNHREVRPGVVRFEAEGYRMGPAGDH
jgi:hypothetical protein